MPFKKLSDYELEQECKSCHTRLKSMLEEAGFKNNAMELKYMSSYKNDNKNELRYYDIDRYNKSCIEESLKIIHFNARRISKNRGNLVAYMALFDKSPDIILLSEIGHDGDHYLQFTFPDYLVDYVDIPKSNKYGGVAILLKKGIFENYVILDHLKIKMTCGCQKCQVENIWLELFKNGRKYTIGCIYRHPNGDVKHFQQKLNYTLSKIPNENTCVAAGDINIDILKYQRENVIDYITQYMANGFIPVITLPTRVTLNTKTIIDHLFIKFPLKLSDTKFLGGVLSGEVTDHLPIFLNIYNEKRKNPKSRPLVRIYSERNYQKFNQELQSLDWERILEIYENTDEKYECFIKNFLSCFEKSFPLKRLSKKRNKDKKWITSAIRVSIRHKERLYNKQIKKPTLQNKETYKSYNKVLSQCIEKAEEFYYTSIIANNKNSATKMWQTVGSILNPEKTKKRCTITKLIYEDKEVFTSKDIANSFNDFFCNIGKKLASSIKTDQNFHEYLGTPNPHTLFLRPITANEITKEIHSLQLKKSPGHDNITSKLLKSCHMQIINPLSLIFNHSIETAVYPTQMKLAKVLALYKKQERYLPENYRPISLLSCLDKIFEKLLYSRFINFFTKHQLLILQQYGFLKDHSTLLALINHIDPIKKYLDQKEYVLAIYLDLKKAFDTVDPKILFKKLYHYGIRGHSLKLIQSYFTDRTQYTLVNNTASNIMNIDMGVPQGSVLGPLFFLIYINDIINCLNNEEATLISDDSTAIVHDKNLSILKRKGEVCIENLDKWLKANRLTLSLEKTIFMIYHSKKKKISGEYDQLKFGHNTIKRVSHVKYLGMILDDTFSWDLHVQYVCNSISRYFGIFYNIRKLIPHNLKKLLYFSFIHSKITYGIELYGTCSSTLLNKIQTLQNKLLKVLYIRPYRTNSSVLHHELGLLKIIDIFKVSILKFVFKVLNKEIIKQFFNYFETRERLHDHDTRHKKLLHVKDYNTNFGITRIAIKGAFLWNQYASDKKIRSLYMLKRAMKIRFLDLYVQN